MVCISKAVNVEIDIDIYDLSRVERIVLAEELYGAGVTFAATKEIKYLIDQAKIETSDMMLPPYLRELLQAITQQTFGR